MTSFREEYGDSVDLPVNAVCYELSDGGDLVRGNPTLWHRLRVSVLKKLRSYPDISQWHHKGRVYAAVDRWLYVNEKGLFDDRL